MDRTRRRKLAAAIAAVIAHLAAEAPHAAAPAEGPPPPQPPPPGPSPWALTGRHDAMLLRSLWQRRLSRTW